MEPPTPPPPKKQKVHQPSVRPSVPEGWDRCHAYMERKGRFCRQEVLPTLALSGQFYCGNHRHLYSSSTSTAMSSTTAAQEVCIIQDIIAARKRIPCPIDPTHHIYEDMLEKHIEKCPKTIEQRKQQQQTFYRPNCNCGGHGRLTNHSTATARTQQHSSPKKDSNTSVEHRDLDWAKRVAMTILETYNRLFPMPSFLPSKDTDVTQLTQSEICQNNDASIPLLDLSRPEYDAGFQSAISDYRIKSGGQRHMHQQASMIGHLRRIGILEALDCRDSATTNRDDVKSNENTSSHAPCINCTDDNHNTAARIILEMGAGRGMTGLVIAGVSAMNQKVKTQLTMIERSASRSRAEKFLRKVKQFESSFPTSTNYMNLSNVQWNRIQCDLSHVNIQTALIPTIDMICETNARQPRTCNDIVVVAKHLCGVGTDLALKSIEPIRDSVSAVIMSTCCHGVCSWNDYVGREYLLDAIRNTDTSSSSEVWTFGKDEFDLLRLWSSGTVLDANVTDTSSKENSATKVSILVDSNHSDRYVLPVDDDDDDVHPTANGEASTNGSDINVAKVVDALNLKCGVQGLGRVCQRLIDFGRGEYLRRVIFHNSSSITTDTINNDNNNDSNSKVELIYYVPESITPQNALLIGYRSKIK